MYTVVVNTVCANSKWCVCVIIPVVFPDLGGPITANLMGTAGPGDGVFTYLPGSAMKHSLASLEEG